MESWQWELIRGGGALYKFVVLGWWLFLGGLIKNFLGLGWGLLEGWDYLKGEIRGIFDKLIFTALHCAYQ